jgi:hypothetical protein
MAAVMRRRPRGEFLLEGIGAAATGLFSLGILSAAFLLSTVVGFLAALVVLLVLMAILWRRFA